MGYEMWKSSVDEKKAKGIVMPGALNETWYNEQLPTLDVCLKQIGSSGSSRTHMGILIQWGG
jgi:hypothetical protein